MRRASPSLLWWAPVALAAVALAQGTATVGGTVTNALTGEPLLRVRVTLFNYDRDGEHRFGGMTDAQGQFTITGLPPGSYAAMTERVGFVRDRGMSRMQTSMIQLRAGDKKDDLKLKLTPAGSIAGRVLDSEGEPVESVAVSAEGPDYGQSAQTDEKGQFRIGGLGPGKYRIRARPVSPMLPPEIRTDGTVEVHHTETWYPNSTVEASAGRVEVQAGMETSGIEIPLARVPIVRVSGKVRGLPEGAQNVMVEIRQERGGGRGAPLKPDGSFELWRLDPGKYTLSAAWRRAGLEELRSAPVEVEVGATNVDNIELSMVTPADIAGRVIFEDEPPAQPNRPEQQRARQLLLRELAGRMGSRPAQIAADNSFLLEKVPPGRFRVMLMWPGAYVKSIRLGPAEMPGGVLDLSNGAGGAELTLVVSWATGQVEGTVPESAVNTLVALVPEDPQSGLQPRFSMTSGSATRFRFDGIPPGKYKLVALEESDAGMVMRSRDLSEYGDEVESVEVRAKEKTTKDLTRRATAP